MSLCEETLSASKRGSSGHQDPLLLALRVGSKNVLGSPWPWGALTVLLRDSCGE